MLSIIPCDVRVLRTFLFSSQHTWACTHNGFLHIHFANFFFFFSTIRSYLLFLEKAYVIVNFFFFNHKSNTRALWKKRIRKIQTVRERGRDHCHPPAECDRYKCIFSLFDEHLFHEANWDHSVRPVLAHVTTEPTSVPVNYLHCFDS